jgi:hypothetical protein
MPGARTVFISGIKGPARVSTNVKPQMQTPTPMLNCFRRTALYLVSLAALLIVVSSGAFLSKIINKIPVSPIVFGHLAVPTSTNANFVCVTLTNQSDFVVYYLTKPLQVSSNGIWSGPPGPPRQRLTELLARQSGVVVVDATSTNESTRVPVLWGYYDYTPGAPRWQQLTEDFVSRVRGHGGRGFLYTSYLTDLKP